MPLNYNKIEKLIEGIGKSRSSFAKEIGMSDTGFRDALEKKTLKTAVLEKIADFFDVPIDYFFDREGEGNVQIGDNNRSISGSGNAIVEEQHTNYNSRHSAEVELLREKIKSLEQLNKDLRAYNNELLEQVKFLRNLKGK